MSPRIADLFCGAGGAGMGLHRAGFEVVGFDIEPQPHYPFEFHQADALTVNLSGFDAVWASPPCQAFTALKSMWNGREHPDLVEPTRSKLKAAGLPYIIENVPGAPLIEATVRLCGTMFNLGTGDAELRRHRIFEITTSLILTPPCNHYDRGRVIGVYGGHGRDRRRTRPATVGVWGSAGGRSVRDGTQQFSTDERREAMGIDWMTGAELSQAVPPAYSEYLGRQLLAQMAVSS